MQEQSFSDHLGSFSKALAAKLINMLVAPKEAEVLSSSIREVMQDELALGNIIQGQEMLLSVSTGFFIARPPISSPPL